jgi:hypothetical protein
MADENSSAELKELIESVKKLTEELNELEKFLEEMVRGSSQASVAAG